MSLVTLRARCQSILSVPRVSVYRTFGTCRGYVVFRVSMCVHYCTSMYIHIVNKALLHDRILLLENKSHQILSDLGARRLIQLCKQSYIMCSFILSLDSWAWHGCNTTIL